MLLRNDKQPITGSVERGTRSPHGLKELAYMKRKSAGNKAHLQPVTHFLVHIGIGIARVVFQRAGTKFRYVTLVVLQDRAHGGCVAVCRCGNDRERQQIFRLPNGIHNLFLVADCIVCMKVLQNKHLLLSLHKILSTTFSFPKITLPPTILDRSLK